MKLYEIFIDNNLEYEDWECQSKLIVANSLHEAEMRADGWMKKVYGTSSYGKPSSWAEERTEVDGFKITVSR
ncbi:hypothetical protein JDW21_19285 [Bacillus subtilis]|uniref:hypothetical protein n=1 Tax=Bacillus subtilis group TaxID=653685 RepID=UPI00200EF79A|nr:MULTISPECIES: hypothetical protein [Bacillus subtilis group]MCR4362053.1 hypothetical protein [Bacillus subtilis]UQB84332.1 hypothetical protein KMZ31_19625 [Bacillus amyloliquefaciens]